MLRKTNLLVLLLIAYFSLFGQNNGSARLGKLLRKSLLTQQKDNPGARLEFERLKTRNPATGQPPAGIHEKELAYYKAELQSASNARTASEIISWTNRGPHNVGGRTRALAIDVSNEDVILAGGVSGGVWRSADGGQTWNKTTGSNDLQSVSAIAQDTRAGHTDTWYYTTGELSGNSASGFGASYNGDGIFKSIDGGMSWEKLSSTQSGTPQTFDACFDYNHEVVVSPSNGNVYIANYCGIYRSVNGGTSWSQVYDSPGSGGWSDVAVTSNGTIYAYVLSDGVIQSVNNGDNWTNVSDAAFPAFDDERGELAIATSNEDIVYLLAQDSSAHALWRYNADTDTWVNRTSSIPQLGGATGDFDSQGGYDLLIKVKPDNENFVIIGGTNLFRSTDGFASTTNTDWIGGYTPENNSFGLYTDHHPDQHSFVFYPSDPDKVISGNDGGLQFTSDIESTSNATFPVTWTPINNGYLTTQVYAVSVGPQNQILAGFQDNGTWFTSSTNPEASWSDPFSGDGAYSAFSSDGTVRYMSAQNAFIYKLIYSDANDESLNNLVEFAPATGYKTSLFITPFYLDPEDDDIFYLGGDDVLLVNTQAATGTSSIGWKSIVLPGISGVVSEFGVVGNGTTYLGTSGGQIYKVEDVTSATPVVTNISPAELSGAYVSGIGVNQLNPNELVAVVSNYSVQSIFHSTDGGSSWAHVGGNLEENEDGSGNGPSIRTVQILGDGDVYLVGTSVGLFTTETLDGNSTIWAQEDIENLGAVVVEHLVVRNSDGLIVVGTHGNGVFSASLPVASVDLEVVSIDNPESGIMGVESIVVTISNNGSEAQSGYQVSYSVDGELQQTETIDETLVPGATYQHTFGLQYDFSAPGGYEIVAEVSADNDEISDNNISSRNITQFFRVVQYPYNEGFESETHNWSLNGIWETGTPSQTLLSSASSGSGVLMTDLDANYANDAFDAAISPVFDFSDLKEPKIAFDIIYSIEEDFDGALIGYRTDLTADFTPLTSGAENWYDGPVSAIGGLEAWTGLSSGYVRATADLTSLAGEPQVQLAFFFVSDGSVAEEGIAVDQFEIVEGSAIGSVQITSNTLPENSDISTIVGTVSLTGGSDAIYSLTIGAGDTDNSRFTLDENGELRANEVFDFESKPSYNIRVKAVGDGQVTVEGQLVITVSDANDVPAGIDLSASEIAENLEEGSLVGAFAAVDEDISDSHTYSLVEGDGDDDNASFALDGSDLYTSRIFDFEEKNSYSIRVGVTDSGDGSVEQSFTISVANANDPPENITLSNNVVPGDQTSGFEVGILSADDQDGDELSFSLMEGTGDDDNESFSISGVSLQTNGLTIANSDEEFRVLIEAADGKGGFNVQPFTISVEEIILLINLAKNGISMFPNPVADVLNLKIDNKFTGKISMDIFTSEGKTVYRQSWQKQSEIFRDRIELHTLPQGVYQVRFSMNGKTIQGKVVKQ